MIFKFLRRLGSSGSPGASARTVARCRAHVLERIEAAVVAQAPFHHLFVERIWPPDFHAAMRAHMMQCKDRTVVADRDQDSTAFVNRRHNLFAAEDDVSLCVRAVFSDAEVRLALLRKFYVASLDELAAGLAIHHEFEYVFTRAGRSQTIHLDIPPKFLSFVFYIPTVAMTPEEAAANATILYDKALRPHHCARFEANSLCIFAPHFHSYHGFDSTRDRDVLVMFYIDPAGLERYAAMRDANRDDAAPFAGFRDEIERKLRQHPLIEYGPDEARLLHERAACLINAPNGRVVRPDPVGA